MGDQPDLLQHILDELASIKTAITSVRDDVIALKVRSEGVENLTLQVKDHSDRLAKLEVGAAAWAGAAGASTAVLKWAAGVMAALLVAGIGGALGMMLRR